VFSKPLTPESSSHGPRNSQPCFSRRSLAEEALKYFREPHSISFLTHNTTNIILPLDDSGCTSTPRKAVGWDPAISHLRHTKHNDHLQRRTCLDGSAIFRTPTVNDNEQFRSIRLFSPEEITRTCILRKHREPEVCLGSNGRPI